MNSGIFLTPHVVLQPVLMFMNMGKVLWVPAVKRQV